MSITGNETNWEQFFDNFFEAYGAEKEKKMYPNGCLIFYKGNRILVCCDLDKTGTTIIKLEFSTEGNDIAGIFTNKDPQRITFQQTFIDTEYEKEYELPYSKDNAEIIANFLRIPCEQGWIEEDFIFTPEGHYMTTVRLNNSPRKWVVKLRSQAEFDFGGIADAWLRCVIYNAPWNASKRTSIVKEIEPMNDNKLNHPSP